MNYLVARVSLVPVRVIVKASFVAPSLIFPLMVPEEPLSVSPLGEDSFRDRPRIGCCAPLAGPFLEVAALTAAR